ncbi:MAG: tRNA epoxyqueuosine(34) reductase QueG [Thiotrichales bacterium]
MLRLRLMPDLTSAPSPAQLWQQISAWSTELGFGDIGVSHIDLDEAGERLQRWLARGFHGEMSYMSKHGSKRYKPAELVPGTLSIISLRMDYHPPETADEWMVLNNPELGYISRYALGRDYHKVLRQRLKRLCQKIETVAGTFAHRIFVDSAPVMEKDIAVQAGLGWQGKHTNVLNRRAGSWFFLGEIYTTLPLPAHQAESNHCGSCTACIDICPTRAIVAPYELDARLCISYLTIELKGSIPEGLRPLIGNRIYGCDDCQLICPWNRFAQTTALPDFGARHGLDAPALLDLAGWTEAEFLSRFEGSPIRRIGYVSWLRNIAVALGNGPADGGVIQRLTKLSGHDSEVVREHACWALSRVTDSTA